jgi:hypothetical protein
MQAHHIIPQEVGEPHKWWNVHTNAEAANSDLSPQLKDGNFATLHHIGQNAKEPLVEASTKYHGVGKPDRNTLY